MESDELSVLQLGMETIQSRKMIRDFTRADYPNMKDEDRKKIHRNMFKIAYPDSMKKRALKASDLRNIPDISAIARKKKSGRKNPN